MSLDTLTDPSPKVFKYSYFNTKIKLRLFCARFLLCCYMDTQRVTLTVERRPRNFSICLCHIIEVHWADAVTNEELVRRTVLASVRDMIGSGKITH